MDCSGNNLSANTPQFFKIILENTMQEGKLGIPRKFIMEYGNDLQEYVTLVVPDGANWQIKLTKTEDGQVCMEQGWLDFAKHYSISYGNFLVFKPRGISKFLVLIFDTTGLEIKYAPITTRSCNSQSDREIKLLENCEMKNAREDSPNSCPRPHKRKRSDDCIIIESSSSLGAECGTLRQKKAKRDADLHVPLRKFKGGGLTSSSRGYKFEDAWKKRHFSVVEKAKLLERARAFRSSKPCFKVVINPTAAYRKATLHVPSVFAQKYFTQKMGDVILKNKMGRTWTANYMYKEISGKSWLRAKLTRGWKDFCVDNKLEVGDVCMFEMIKCRKMTLNVVIFRARKNMSRIPRLQPKDDGTVKRSTSKQKAKLLGKAQDLKSIKPSFKVTMHSSTVHSENKAPSMNVPAKFAKKYLTSEKGDVIIYDMKGRTWCISYYCCENRSSSQLKFTGGWKKFSEDNNLKVGDVCIFEMDNCKNITFKVIIIRKCVAVNCLPLPGTSAGLKNKKNSGGGLTSRSSHQNLLKVANKSTKNKSVANKFTTAYPCFAVEIKSSYLRGCLTVPSSFALLYIKNGASTIKLSVGHKSWEVKLSKYKGGACKISAGWTAFARENSLKLKDICKFELIQSNDIAFKVSISRNMSTE